MPAYDPMNTIKKDLEHKIEKERQKSEKALEKKLVKHRIAQDKKMQRELDKTQSRVNAQWERKRSKIETKHKKKTQVSINNLRKAAWDGRIKVTKVARKHSEWTSFADEVFMFIVKATGADRVWKKDGKWKFRAQCMDCGTWSSAIHPGHVFSKKDHWGIRRDYRNCHHQCGVCNFKQGTGAPSENYKNAVIAKIGQDQWDDLYQNKKSIPKKTTVQIMERLEENIPKIPVEEFREKMQKKYEEWKP